MILSSLIITYFLLFAIEGEDVYEGLLVIGMKPVKLDFILGLMAFGIVVPFSCAYMVGCDDLGPSYDHCGGDQHDNGYYDRDNQQHNNFNQNLYVWIVELNF